MIKKLETLRNKRNELIEKSRRSDVSDEDLKTILEELRKVNDSISLCEELLKASQDDSTNDDSSSGDDSNGDDSRGAGVPVDPSTRNFKPKFSTKDSDGMTDDEKRSLEYRKAFREYVMRGTKIPAELRVSTVTSDVTAVIPENLIAQIIDSSKDVGMIFKAVTHTNFKVGQKIPLASFRPTVQYVAEGSGNTVQKAGESKTYIIFNHFKADCRLAWTYETDLMTLEVWEKYFVEKVVEAITFWKESEILTGTGTDKGHVTGILTQTPAFEKAIDEMTYSDLLDLEGNLPSNKDGAKWYMSKKTFFNTFKNIMDDTGQPVAETDHGTDGKLIQRILGREVVFIDEYLPNHKGSGTKANSITAFMYDFKDYVFNENYNLGIKQRENWENEDQEMKVVFACDGKPTFTDSLIVVKRKTDVA